jgi:cell wall-associated NlpC family hydrolase
MATTTSRTFSRALALVGALSISLGLFVVSAPDAGATTNAAAVSTPVAPARAATVAKPTFSARILKTVASRKGSPYSYGASGPHRFDCSGLTMWTFKRLGHRLPHNSAAQYGRVKHLRASDRRPGDLVFFHDGGGIYHVAIYAGHNRIWHAPYTGARVREERLWTNAVYYGRVR